jgi:hypothetical protein
MGYCNLSKQGVVHAISQLKRVNIIRLVKKGDSRKSSNRYEIVKDIKQWKLVNRSGLVKFPILTSQIYSTPLCASQVFT